MLETIVQVQGVGRVYIQKENRVEALVSATCSVKSGERIALVGQSGSGKSTLLHLMGGLDEPSTGIVSWPALGEKNALRPEKIGFVFQMPSLLSSLNVVENVKLPLLLMGGDSEKAHLSAVEILERIELAELINKLPQELSGGQLQRVALARALVIKPKLILADEPTGQLDHPTSNKLFDVLLDYIKDTNTSLVVATHDAAIAERMNKTWKMNHGVLEVEDL